MATFIVSVFNTVQMVCLDTKVKTRDCNKNYLTVLDFYFGFFLSFDGGSRHACAEQSTYSR